ncbi:unnamed protein product, partial [Prorocentrum cordatum]
MRLCGELAPGHGDDQQRHPAPVADAWGTPSSSLCASRSSNTLALVDQSLVLYAPEASHEDDDTSNIVEEVVQTKRDINHLLEDVKLYRQRLARVQRDAQSKVRWTRMLETEWSLRGGHESARASLLKAFLERAEVELCKTKGLLAEQADERARQDHEELRCLEESEAQSLRLWEDRMHTDESESARLSRLLR